MGNARITCSSGATHSKLMVIRIPCVPGKLAWFPEWLKHAFWLWGWWRGKGKWDIMPTSPSVNSQSRMCGASIRRRIVPTLSCYWKRLIHLPRKQKSHTKGEDLLSALWKAATRRGPIKTAGKLLQRVTLVSFIGDWFLITHLNACVPDCSLIKRQ